VCAGDRSTHFGNLAPTPYARATAASRKNNANKRGLGSRRRTCHIMMLIDPILRAGESANESVGQAPNNLFRVLAHLSLLYRLADR